ncbi:MAG: hypothetical protein LBI84_08515, partial [Propionibacteriaceae bacterium]|nr:hypothetical protein [Propionibacteriaceae bacterium]
MRQPFVTAGRITLSALAGCLIAAGLAIGNLTATAGPDSTPTVIGSVLPLALDEWGGPAGWAEQNANLLTSEGYDPETVGAAADQPAVTADPATGKVSVGNNCAEATTVHYALGDAVGQLSVSIDNAHFDLADVSAITVNQEQAVALLPKILLHVEVVDLTERDYWIDFTDGTATPVGKPSSIVDPQVQTMVTASLEALQEPLRLEVAQRLQAVIEGALAEITLSASQDIAIPYSFGVAFGSDGISTGDTATVDLASVIAESWLGQLSGTTVLDQPAETISWRDFVPADVVAAVTDTPAESWLDANIDIAALAWDKVRAEIVNLVDNGVESAAAEFVA